MLKKSKILSVICFFVCVLLILTSCNSSKKPTSGETGTENTTENTSAVSDTAGATETEAYPDVVINREFEHIEDGKLNIVIGGGASQLPAKPGDEVSVKIELKNNNVISSLKMILSYDPKLSVVTDVNA